MKFYDRTTSTWRDNQKNTQFWGWERNKRRHRWIWSFRSWTDKTGEACSPVRWGGGGQRASRRTAEADAPPSSASHRGKVILWPSSWLPELRGSAWKSITAAAKCCRLALKPQNLHSHVALFSIQCAFKCSLLLGDHISSHRDISRDVSWRVFCLLFNIMKSDGTLLVELKET